MTELVAGSGRRAEELMSAGDADDEGRAQCRLCLEWLLPAHKDAHLRRHSNESEWLCSECGFTSFIQVHAMKSFLKAKM